MLKTFINKCFRGVFILLMLTSCRPEILKESSVCYNLENAGKFYIGDTLVVKNCSIGDFVWMAVVKDSMAFKTNFLVYTINRNGYWRIPLKDTGHLVCRICAGFKNGYAEVKLKDFEIYVEAPKR